MAGFGDRVIKRTRALKHPLCVSLDPYLDRIPSLFPIPRTISPWKPRLDRTSRLSQPRWRNGKVACFRGDQLVRVSSPRSPLFSRAQPDADTGGTVDFRPPGEALGEQGNHAERCAVEGESGTVAGQRAKCGEQFRDSGIAG